MRVRDSKTEAERQRRPRMVEAIKLPDRKAERLAERECLRETERGRETLQKS